MDLNRVMLIGRVTSDLEVKKMEQSGNSVVNFTIVTNRRYKNKEGNLVEEAEFHRVVAYGPLADRLGQYLQKGSRVYAEGRLRTRKWEDTSGNTRSSTEIILDNVIFLDPKNRQPVAAEQAQPAEAAEAVAEQSQDEELPF